MGDSKCRFKVVVRGKVQGVGFRAWVTGQAESCNLAGWVRNLPDGSVEGIFEGYKSEIDEMLISLQRGPRLARVDEVEVVEEAWSGEFSGFNIVR